MGSPFTERLENISRANVKKTCDVTLNVKVQTGVTPLQPHPDYEEQDEPVYTETTLTCRVTDTISGKLQRTYKGLLYDTPTAIGLLNKSEYFVQYPSGGVVTLAESDKVKIHDSWYTVTAVVRDSTGVQETAFMSK